MARAWKHRGMTSSSMRTRILRPVLAALILAAACDEPTAPRPLGRLVSIQPDGTVMETMSASSMTGTHRRAGGRVIMVRVVAPQAGTMQVDTMLFRNGALEQTKLMGMYCTNEPCPAPRNFLLRYEQR